MTTTDRMDGDLRAWLLAEERPATYLDDVRAATVGVRQRRPTGPLSWVPTGMPFAHHPLSIRILVALLALTMLAGTLAVGAAILRDRAVIPVQTDGPLALQGFQIADRSNDAWIGIALELEVKVEDPFDMAEEQRMRFFADGAGRFRLERTREFGSSAREFSNSVEVTIDLVGEGTWYRAETWYSAESGPDGVTRWWDESAQSHFGPYPLQAPFPCSGGWEYVGVGTVVGRATHHLRCTGGNADLEAWVDRETFLVLRTVGFHPGGGGLGDREVVAIAFGPQDPSLFELPAGASPVPRT
jgi:hypothetical protein